MKLHDLYSTPFDFQSGAFLTFATIAELSDFDDRDIGNGGVVYVESYRDYFQKVVESQAPATSPNMVVPTATGDGGWYRLCIASPTWGTQTAWYIDPVAGDDENTGALNASIQTWAEFRRRTGDVITGDITVTILSAISENLVGNFTSFGAREATLRIYGTPTVLATGSGTTTFVNPVALTNTRGTTTVGGGTPLDFTPYVGKMLRVATDSTSVGSISRGPYFTPILKVVATVAQTPYWMRDGGANTTVPAANRDVEVVDLTPARLLQITAVGVVFDIRYLAFDGTTETVNAISSIGNALGNYGTATSDPATSSNIGQCFACSFRSCAVMVTSPTRFLSCLLLSGSMTLFNIAPMYWYGGGCIGGGGTLYGSFPGTVNFIGFIVQGGNVAMLKSASSFYLSSGGLGVFDAPAGSPAIDMTMGTIEGAAALYGANPLATYGLRVQTTARVKITTTVPTIAAGAGNDISFATGATAIPPPTSGSPATWGNASAIATWAQWQAAPFNKKVFDYSSGACIVGV